MTCLDIVSIVKDREEAARLGEVHNQEGVTHLLNLEYIPTGGTSEAR